MHFRMIHYIIFSFNTDIYLLKTSQDGNLLSIFHFPCYYVSYHRTISSILTLTKNLW